MKLRSALLLSLFLSLNVCPSSFAEPGKLSGTVDISKDLASKLKPTDVLFIIVREMQVGPPTAVKRVMNPKFPLQYVVGPEDAMMAAAAETGFQNGTPLTVAARISRTGNAMPSAGDLEGVYAKNPAKPGQNKVNILINRERTR